ncbi:MAG TPA: very short patch repair endonuclease [Acidimicrobiia bacterium]
MRTQRRRDTRPEIALRRELHARGLRYRVNVPVLDGSRKRHDVVFSRARVVVEVMGCFWHSCPLHGTRPKSNSDWWATKLERNSQRDRETAADLDRAGWLLVVVWEHEPVLEAAERVEHVVRTRTRGLTTQGA